MAKTITIRDDVYEKLVAIKKGRSFSEVILELINNKKKKVEEIITKFAGKLKDTDLYDIVMKERKKFRVREFDI